MARQSRDEHYLLSTSYTMALIELGYRVTRWMIEDAEDSELEVD
jgi:hypothetical protein